MRTTFFRVTAWTQGALLAASAIAAAWQPASAQTSLPISANGSTPLSGGYKLVVRPATSAGGVVGMPRPVYQFSVVDAQGTTVPSSIRFQGLPLGTPTTVHTYPADYFHPNSRLSGEGIRNTTMSVRVGDQTFLNNQRFRVTLPQNIQWPKGSQPPRESLLDFFGPTQEQRRFLPSLEPDPENIPAQDGKGPLVPCVNSPCRLSQLMDLGRRIFNFLMSLGAVAAVAAIVVAGYHYILSRGDPRELSDAKTKLTFAIIGLIVLLLAVVIVNTILTRLGYTGSGGGQLRGVPELPGG